MASKAMDVADACPTEDFIAALLEYLVEPKLHGESSAKGDISQIAQESIAKQVHAVVLLYNYYHRKQYPQLEFLCFESFCKLAVVIKPALMAHIRLFQRSNDTESQPFPLLEESIMEACSISMSLDASEDDLNIDGWPISKVAVFLVDSRKENCFLQFGSITEGVWSVIEKDVDVSNNSLEVPVDSDHVNKKKRIIKKPLKGKSSSKEGHFQQFAFSAVKEATGIDQSNLVVLESHVTYSTSTEKTAVYFYIMQLTKADNSIALQIPIKNTIDSLQGPLALKSSRWWTHTSVVEYFLLLPYAEVLSDWLLREGLSDGVQVQRVGLETINISSSDWSERPCEAEVSERYHNHVNDSAAELLGSETITQSLKHNDNNGCLGSEMISSKQNLNDKRCVVDLSGDRDRTQKMDVDESYMAHTQNKHKRSFSCKDQPQNCQKKTITENKCIEGLASKMETVEKCSKGSASGDKVRVDLVDWTISQKIPGCVGAVATDGNKNCNNIVADQDRMSVTDNAVVTCQSNSKNLDKLHTILVSKEKELSDAALTVVLSKRDRLSLQLRDIEDQIALCDKDIETILMGGEDNLSLKIESLIEGCNFVSLRSVSRERTYEGPKLVSICQEYWIARHYAPIMKNSCRGLDDVCYENRWILPNFSCVETRW
ncbi:ALEURONE LAYER MORPHOGENESIS PROTEIN [Salix koriyanagi]|uniref:ALEURONE LAYER MORPHOGENESIS PROTEIN n=1 Tax=Salix koriyanagi TaxID=2511006 RepID=A0A9Q0UQ63_9ROSI|nr:ALEURONE LAYER MORPHOGENESIS PROTEIN [Salix koriyanagi]